MLRQRCLWGFRRPVWGALATFPHPLPWRPVVGPCSPLFYFLRLLLACLIYVSSETLIRLPYIRPSYNYPISLPNTTSLTHFTPLTPYLQHHLPPHAPLLTNLHLSPERRAFGPYLSTVLKHKDESVSIRNTALYNNIYILYNIYYINNY